MRASIQALEHSQGKMCMMFFVIAILRLQECLALLLLCACAITLMALELPLGWIILGMGVVVLYFCEPEFRKYIGLIYGSLALLGITSIDTDISYGHMFSMGLTLLLAVSIPYCVSRYVYKDHVIRFPWHHGRNWYKKEVYYILFTVVVSYLFLPFYLRDTGAYLNWSVDPGAHNLTRLFIGTNALGIWDELFFVSTVLGILRRFLPFTWANIIQSVLFTSFLYELGFTGWIPPILYLFALLQGYVFKKTDSLLYVVTIHLSLDFILYLALIDAHHPTWIPIFIT